MLKLKLKRTISKIVFTFNKNLKVFLLLTLPFLAQLSCNTTEPTDELKPGRRDYTWAVDTVKIPFNYLRRFWGSSPNDVWAVGSGGGLDQTIWHFDGNGWSERKLNEINTEFVRIKRDKTNGKYYLLGLGGASTTIVSMYEYDGGAFIKRIYNENYSFENNAIPQLIDQEVFFLIGYNINTYENGAFKTYLNIYEPKFGGQIWGRNINDIFLRMLDGFSQYNGQNIEYLFHFNSSGLISIQDVVIFDNELFVLVIDYDKNQNIVYRGKLN